MVKDFKNEIKEVKKKLKYIPVIIQSFDICFSFIL